MIKLYLISFFVAMTFLANAQGVVVNPDGTHSVIAGSVVINPDGTHSVIHATGGAHAIAIGPDGRHSIIVGWNQPGTPIVVNTYGTHSVEHLKAFMNSSSDAVKQKSTNQLLLLPFAVNHQIDILLALCHF